MREQSHLSTTSGGYFSGSVLKYIAMVTMLIDHLTKTVLYPWGYTVMSNWAVQGQCPWETVELWYYVTGDLLVKIGRMAFPIFCFLLVEGFLHTRNQKQYLARLVVFAVIAELPFDMAFFYWSDNFPLYFYYQNVLFTLSLGVCMMMVLEQLGDRMKLHQKHLPMVLLQCGVAGMFGWIAEWGMTDYGSTGIYYIFLLYLLRGNRWGQGIAVVVIHFMAAGGNGSLFVIVSGLVIALYNGTRGTKHPKYFFYAFYPVHLLVLYLVKYSLALT